MLTQSANENSRLSWWLRVREYAVPPSMIETATARRRAGDWSGACAAAGIDVDFNLRLVAHTYGREVAARLRADLRHLAPDLLRWHMPRIAPDGLLRPGLTIALARYDTAERAGPVHLVARTPPAWADAGQRIGLALWDESHRDARHPHPDRRFRLDLHRHLWDARRTDELRIRSGADRHPESNPDLLAMVPQGHHCAVDRWAAEAEILLRAEGRPAGPVAVRLGARHRLILHPEPPAVRLTAAPANGGTLLVLPDVATWVLPDLDLIRTGRIEPDRLHPLVASALAPDHSPARTPDRAGQPRHVNCRGAQHRIGLVDGVLAPLDHDPAEIRREELLVALTGTPLPCLQVIDQAHRHPDSLAEVRARLDHGDIAGALAAVEDLLGPDALLRNGALRDELEAAAQRRITYGLFRADLIKAGPRPDRRRPRARRSHPRHSTFH